MRAPQSPRDFSWSAENISSFWNAVELCHLAEQSFAKNAGDALIDLVGSHFFSGCRILDFGAGNGFLTEKLLARGYQVAVYEPSEERYAKIIERVGQNPNFLGTISLDSEQRFDIVFLVEVIEHVYPQDLQALLRTAVRFTSRSGKLVVTTPNNENLDSSKVLCPGCNQLFHNWQHLSSFTVDRLLKELAPQGVYPVQVVLADFSKDASTVEDLKRSRDTLNCLDISLRDLFQRLEIINQRFDFSFSQIPHYSAISNGEEPTDIEPLSYKASPEVKHLMSLMTAIRSQGFLRRLVFQLKLVKNIFNIISIFVRDLSDQRKRALDTLNEFRDLRQELIDIHRDFHNVFSRAQNMPMPLGNAQDIVCIGKESTILFVGVHQRE